jgi:DNA-binding GntR family transcriptional regulator
MRDDDMKRCRARMLGCRPRSGQLRAGSRITEAEIAETYEAARSTARRTLAALRDEGLRFTVPQRGSYVR